jgi:hypothetical protein
MRRPDVEFEHFVLAITEDRLSIIHMTVAVLENRGTELNPTRGATS